MYTIGPEYESEIKDRKFATETLDYLFLIDATEFLVAKLLWKTTPVDSWKLSDQAYSGDLPKTSSHDPAGHTTWSHDS